MTDLIKEHEWDNPDCPRCWGGEPMICKAEGPNGPCGGLVHFEWGVDEGGAALGISECHRCGEDPNPTTLQPGVGQRCLPGPSAARHPMTDGRLVKPGERPIRAISAYREEES